MTGNENQHLEIWYIRKPDASEIETNSRFLQGEVCNLAVLLSDDSQSGYILVSNIHDPEASAFGPELISQFYIAEINCVKFSGKVKYILSRIITTPS